MDHKTPAGLFWEQSCVSCWRDWRTTHFVEDLLRICLTRYFRGMNKSSHSVICTTAVCSEIPFHFAFLIRLTCSFGRGAPSASVIRALSSGPCWAVITSSFVDLLCFSLDVCSLFTPCLLHPFLSLSLFFFLSNSFINLFVQLYFVFFSVLLSYISHFPLCFFQQSLQIQHSYPSLFIPFLFHFFFFIIANSFIYV